MPTTKGASGDGDGWEVLRRQLRGRTAISRTELASLVHEHVGVGVDYAARRLRREDLLARAPAPSRGLYVVGRAASDSDFFPSPIEAVLARVHEETYFCYGSALYLHGLSRYGRLNDYHLGTSKPRNQRMVGQLRVHFVKTPVDDTVGVVATTVDAIEVRITDVERTLIDCIHRPKYAQGWENVLHALKRVGPFDLDRAHGYLKLYRLPSLVAKCGAVFERFAEPWDLAEADLDRLRAYLPKSPVSFSRNVPGKLDKRWNIYVPDGLMEG